jgi:hypothetical protein
MDMTWSSGLFHHPPLGVGCGILLLLAFPFVSLAILHHRPFLPVSFFYTPLLIGFPIAAWSLYAAFRGAALAGNWTFDGFAWGIAEAIAAIGWGAASSFASALFNLRVRRRAMYPVFPITLGLVVASWAGVRLVLR